MASVLKKALVIVLVPVVGAVGLGAWFGSEAGVKVVHYGESNTNVLAVGDRTITLTETHETTKPGTYWLEWTGSHTMLGFARGEHTEAWNVDRARYDRAVRAHLTADRPGDRPGDGPGDRPGGG